MSRASSSSTVLTAPWLLELLRCPRCGQAFARTDECLRCVAGHRFPVADGIPRFTPSSTYADNFGFEWTTFPRDQLDTEGQKESEQTFAVKTGLSPGDVAGKTVLDAGCGMGRFSDVAARWGAAQLVGVDIGRAVEAAAENLSRYPAAAVIQADLRALPFAPASFDVVFSIGVLHHTPSTRETFERVAGLVKPGGVFCIWVYTRKLRRTRGGSELWRLVTRRMKQERLLGLIRWTIPRVERVRRHLRGPALRGFNFLLPVSQHPNPSWRVLDTFDWYSPRYQWKHSFAEVERWFHDLGYEDVRRRDFPVAVSGRRPMGPPPAPLGQAAT